MLSEALALEWLNSSQAEFVVTQGARRPDREGYVLCTADLLKVTKIGMAALNLSTNGPSISKSYQSVVNSSPSSDIAAKSATHAHWVIYSVSAPLINAFQQDSGGESAGKESVLKVQNTGGR